MMIRTFVLSLVVLPAALAAQAPPCFAMNDVSPNASTGVTGTPFVGLNPSSRAYLFTPSTTIVAESGAWFSGSGIRDDYQRIELWSDDGSLDGSPADCLAQGTYFAPFTMGHLWLGANFDAPVPLIAGTRYWVVFVNSGAALVPEEPNGMMTTRRTRTASNAWGAPGMGAPKFRLFCNFLEASGVQSFGSACANSTLNCDPVNPTPRIGTAFVNGPAGAANPFFAIEGSGFPGGAPATLFLGFNTMTPSIPLGPGFPAGCALNTDVAVTVSGMTGVAEIGDQPNMPRPVPFGYVRFALDATTAMLGLPFSAQIVAIDSGAAAPIQVVTSNAMRGTVQ